MALHWARIEDRRTGATIFCIQWEATASSSFATSRARSARTTTPAAIAARASARPPRARSRKPSSARTTPGPTHSTAGSSARADERLDRGFRQEELPAVAWRSRAGRDSSSSISIRIPSRSRRRSRRSRPLRALQSPRAHRRAHDRVRREVELEARLPELLRVLSLLAGAPAAHARSRLPTAARTICSKARSSAATW